MHQTPLANGHIASSRVENTTVRKIISSNASVLNLMHNPEK
jgi:hypothetical protein